MNRGNRKFTTAHFAVATAMLCGTPAAFAQEAETAPVVVAPPPIVQSEPAPVASPTVAPPPVVPTVSVEPDLAEQPKARQTTSRTTAQPTQRARPAPAPSVPRAVATPSSEPTVVNAPNIDGTTSVDSQADTALPTAVADQVPVDQVAGDQSVTPVADVTDDDWMIYGGLAAALGLAGLGGALASRRRKTRSRDAVALEPKRVAPVPTRNMPASMAARPMQASVLAPPAAPLVTPSAAPIRRPSFADQHLPPVTDPLFEHHEELAPVTDPLFMHKTELAPVTDPMFADKAEYAGASANGAAFDKRRDWPNGQGGARPPLHEFEQAE